MISRAPSLIPGGGGAIGSNHCDDDDDGDDGDVDWSTCKGDVHYEKALGSSVNHSYFIFPHFIFPGRTVIMYINYIVNTSP